ncbi:MAG: heme-binding domain-containing protein, partial [Chlorobiaceae bacterium]|nr:heme-binding domain-containing protein [Chlorobiaceae bacterium]
LNRFNPPVTRDIPAEASVKRALKKACYDCHSCETKWQGIAYIAPFSWLASRTVNAGRNTINFSAWNQRSGEKYLEGRGKLSVFFSQRSNHYPHYYLLNPAAKLSAAESDTVSAWLGRFEKEQQARIKNSEYSRQDKTL